MLLFYYNSMTIDVPFEFNVMILWKPTVRTLQLFSFVGFYVI